VNVNFLIRKKYFLLFDIKLRFQLNFYQYRLKMSNELLQCSAFFILICIYELKRLKCAQKNTVLKY